MPKPEYEFHHPQGEWRRAAGAAEGIRAQTLSEDPATGDYTGLLRFEPGVDTSPNGTVTHDFWEEVFILRGDLTDLQLDKTFKAGMYACRPPGMPHGPWRSEEGVLMLEVRYGLS